MLELNLFFQNIANPFLDKLFLCISYLITDIPLVLILCLVYWCVNKDKGLKIGFILLNSMMINFIVKDIFKVKRPYDKNPLIVNKDLKHGYGYSFPSNHSQMASGLAFSFYKVFKSVKGLIISLVIVMLVGLSRIYLGVHTIVDVLTGFLLGGLLVWVLGMAVDYICETKKYYLGYLFMLLGIIGCVAFSDNDSLKITMVYFGFLTGLIIENKFIGFKIPKKMLSKTINFILGVIGVALVYILLSGWLKYLLIGFWVSLGAPAIFTLCHGKEEE